MKLFLNNLNLNTEPSGLFDSLIQLPTEINVTRGDKFQLFYECSLVTPYSFFVRPNCALGNDYVRYFEISDTETTAAGDYPFTLDILDNDYTVLATKTTTIKFRNAVAQPSTNHEYWCIGDSLTENTTWHDEMFRRLTASDGTPLGNGFGNIVKRYEGNGGKGWSWYVGSSSPFWLNGGLDFEQYRINKGYDVPKSVNILMTWNDMNQYRTQSEWDVWDNDVYTFVDALKSDFPNCDVVLMSPQLPSLNGGLGANYGAVAGTYSDLFLEIINAKKQGVIYDRIAGEKTAQGFRHLDTALQFDSRNNMPETSTPVNRRSSKTELIGTNGVHPGTSGYNQIADAAYRDFINNYCQ